VKKAVPNLSAVSMLDWAKMAAYIDGEGSIYISSAQKHARNFPVFTLGLNVSNTDRRLVEWCKSIFGGSIKTKTHPRTKRRTSYIWICYSDHAVAVLNGCIPHFVIKKRQAMTAVAFQCLSNIRSDEDRRFFSPGVRKVRAILCDHLHALKEPKLEALLAERKVEVPTYVQ